MISKLDRLSRDLHFITGLQKSGVRFVVAENPNMNNLTVHLLGAVGEHERKLISERTKDALAAAKARGQRLGNPCFQRGEQIPGSGDTGKANEIRARKADEFAAEIQGVIRELCGDCASLREIAGCLNQAGFRTARGGLWFPTSVKRILDRQP
ncbi:MAG: recombinase family protein [Marinobacterium sp.]